MKREENTFNGAEITSEMHTTKREAKLTEEVKFRSVVHCNLLYFYYAAVLAFV